MKTIQLPDEAYERGAELAALDHVSGDRLLAALVDHRADEWS